MSYDIKYVDYPKQNEGVTFYSDFFDNWLKRRLKTNLRVHLNPNIRESGLQQ